MSSSRRSLSFAMEESLERPLESPHDLLTSGALNNKSRTAVVCLHQHSSFLSSITKSTLGDCLKWTIEELLRASHAFARSLAATVVRPGMWITVFVHNVAEYHVVFRTSLELNCIFATLNLKTSMHGKEAKHVIELLNLSVLVAPNVDCGKKIENAAPEIAENFLLKLFSQGNPEGLNS
ncbi:hypothetical protein BKA65DRAFT_480856 [Rhexocercosporidium sp. MPI-PUGE-AT-0058]|nr:hypothetical protein BKA65DRAFT_480856 [Rhexocercosporidium sp. MPI-PUGE-AT-0058]